MYEIGLTHTLDAAHRVVGHEGGQGKCARLHGHTYTFEVTVAAQGLDELGFVVDFGVIKRLLDEWDHRTLLWQDDPVLLAIEEALGDNGASTDSVVRLPFNPTAENLARHAAERLLEMALPFQAFQHGSGWVEVVCRETAKSMARWRAER